jgi:hypothetical protein
MKKSSIIAIAILLIFLAAPMAASAFSFVDAIKYGRDIFVFVKNDQVPANKDIKTTPKEGEKKNDDVSGWQEKYSEWEKAYSKKDISPLLAKSKEFVFTEEEINYFARQEYNSTSSIASNLSVDLQKDLMIVSGYSRFKPLQGNFSAEIKIIEENGEPVVKVSKARLGKIIVPSFFLNNLINKELKNTKTFIASGKDKKYPKIEIGDGFIKLSYK